MKYLIVLLCSLFFINCGSQDNLKREVSKEENEIEQKVDRAKMIEAGFLSGTISVKEEESGCPFVIVVEDTDGNYNLDPINLETSFQVDGEKIWFTFTGLRMKNRCPNASPININEIQKRIE